MVHIINNDGKTPQTAIVITEAYDDVDEATYLEKFAEYYMIVNDYDKFDWIWEYNRTKKYVIFLFFKKGILVDKLWIDKTKLVYLEGQEENAKLQRELFLKATSSVFRSK